MLKKITILALLVTLSSCLYQKFVIKGKGDIRLSQVDFEELSGWQEADKRQALLSFLNSCKKFAKMPQNRLIGGQIGNITPGDFRDVCEIGETVKGLSDKQINNFFQNWFSPFLVANRNGNSSGLFTGYYEANLHGSKIKTERYKYPIYAKPQDLKNDEPYLSRAEIEAGALADKNLELIYVDDAAELFFLHIQGSGRIILPNGSVSRISFAAKNNQPYVSISNYMADNKFINPGEMSAEKIKQWLRDNPDKAQEAMNSNPSYIFFQFSKNENVVGGQGVELTPEHSLAVDSQIIPYGSLLWVDSEFKNDNIKGNYRGLFVAQDTGSAITGTVRGDIFFGHGQEAEKKASSMASRGEYYMLLPNNAIEKLQ